ncbi:hypothetical protein ACIP4U_30140 [Streptomyces caelestis]|uniref:hypothetical protein n=1 Tax=Streptomyces caelestis TaxID=36816 RepID=UPI0038233F40
MTVWVGGLPVAAGFVYGAGDVYYEGNVSTTAAPTQAQHLTRKDYVDSRVSPAPVTLTDAPTIATNAALGNHFRVTLQGNRTLGTPTNPTDGKRITWELIQDATGNRMLTRSSAFVVGSTIPPPCSPPRRTSVTSSPRSTTHPPPSGT